MDERARRVGRNEAAFRSVNEQIEGLTRGLAALSDNTLHVVCECGSLDCTQQLTVPMEVYEDVRSDPTLFLVRPGHDIPSVEDVVSRELGYMVVRKRPGGPADVARETDPRGPR